MDDRNDALSGGLCPPTPPPELRTRTLSAARQVVDRTNEPDVWTRIWNSRPAQFAWAASVAGLIFAHLVVPNPVSGNRPDAALPLAAAAGADAELAEIAALPRLSSTLPRFEVVPPNTGSRPNKTSEREDRS